MSEQKQYLTGIILVAAALIPGCIVHEPLPFLGECADTEGLDVYEYGQVGIGTCLGGPSDLKVLVDPDDPDAYHLLIVNSNFESNFADGSLLAIPGSGIDLHRETNYLHEVGARAISLPNYPAGVDVSADGRYALVSDRQASKVLGELTDRVYVIDLQDLHGGDGALTFADRGQLEDEEGRSYVAVPTDPHAVVTHPETGLVYVLALTTHQVTVLDEQTSPISVVDVVFTKDVTDAVFEDLDGSGSLADFRLDAFSSSSAQNESWEIRYREGRYELFAAEDVGWGPELFRHRSSDARTWRRSVYADLFTPGYADWDATGYGRASVHLGEGESGGYLRMWVEGIDAQGVTSIGHTETLASWSSDWSLAPLIAPVLEARGDGFEAQAVGEPWMLIDGDAHLLFYTATGSDGVRSVGVAPGDGSSFSHRDEPALAAAGGGAWDADEVYGPSAYRWELTGEDLLYYTGTDGNTPGIGLAVGEDGTGFERVLADPTEPGLVFGPGEPGSWDAAGVAYPAIVHDAGMFHLFYAGTDGTTWAVGHATSFDGVDWVRDPLNPSDLVLGDGSEATAFGLYKAVAGDYFRVEGSVSGLMTEVPDSGSTVARAGETFVNAACPLIFTIVDRHLLGSGDDGDAWEDGSAAPAALVEGDGSISLYYETVEDSRRLLGRARSTDGRSFERLGAVAFTDADSGTVASLDGAGEPAVIDHEGQRLLAFTGWRGDQVAVYVARGDSGISASFTPDNGGEPVLAPVEGNWDTAAIASPSLVAFDGELWLFYQGGTGDEARIGAALAQPDGTFERVDGIDPDLPGLVLDQGGLGQFDDSWVGTPHVRVDGDELVLTYVGHDGTLERLGEARSDDGIHWTRTASGAGVSTPILESDSLGFDQDGIREPMVIDLGGGARALWYEGVRGSVPRIGVALSRDGGTYVKAYRPLQHDEGYRLVTEEGDSDPASSIDLGDDTTLFVDGILVHGSGVSDMALSPDGRHLFVTNKMYDNVYVLDVWDDTTEDYVDANYHQIEAIIQVPNHYSVTGTRGMAFSDDGETMYLLLAPHVRLEDPARAYGAEALLVVDISRLEEIPEPEVLDDLVVGYAATARGAEEDQGNPSVISGGPTNVALSNDGSLAYVAHYNDNSVHVYRLDLGRDPVLVDVIEGLGDEPFDLALSPDGTLLFVVNYVGELEGPTQNVVHSTLTVIDVDPASPTHHHVLTTLRNRDAW